MQPISKMRKKINNKGEITMAEENEEVATSILSDITVFMKYARYREHLYGKTLKTKANG